MKKRSEEALRNISRLNGAMSAPVADFLRVCDDENITGLVDDVLMSKASPEMRAHSLCALLGLFGVGTIVKGRIQ